MRSLATLGLIALTAAYAGTAQAQRAEYGRVTYELSCAVCHGLDARGEGSVSGSLAVPASDLTVLARANGGVFPDAFVAEVIRGGGSVTVHGGQMPAWGLIFLKDFEAVTGNAPVSDAALVERRIEDLVDYLKSVQVP